MKQGKFWAKAAAAVAVIPVSGIIALSGSGAALAATCPAGTVPVMQNGVAGCASSGANNNSPAPTGSPEPVVPIRTAPPADSSTQPPLVPMTPTTNPSVPAPAPVVPTPVGGGDIPLPGPTTTQIEITNGSSSGSTAPASPPATPEPTETSEGIASKLVPSKNSTSSGAAVNTDGENRFTTPPALSEVTIKPVEPAASESSFNPTGIIVTVLSGILVALVGLLFWVNKRHAAKQAG